jgi:hypothetical protein
MTQSFRPGSDPSVPPPTSSGARPTRRQPSTVRLPGRRRQLGPTQSSGGSARLNPRPIRRIIYRPLEAPRLREALDQIPEFPSPYDPLVPDNSAPLVDGPENVEDSTDIEQEASSPQSTIPLSVWSIDQEEQVERVELQIERLSQCVFSRIGILSDEISSLREMVAHQEARYDSTEVVMFTSLSDLRTTFQRNLGE